MDTRYPRCRFAIAALLLIASSRILDAAEPAPLDPLALATRLDEQLATEVPATAADTAAPKSSDEVFLRRVCLDLVGRPPSPEQITRFALDPNPRKREQLVEQLLADDHYAENWARYWRDVIFYRRTEERSILAANSCTDYLTEQLRANRPWSQVATSFITATGDVQENGATALIFAQGGETEATVSEVSRIFLGIQIQCAQCHDHPTDRWKREQFHQLAAFFPRVAVRQSMPNQQRTFTVTVTDSEPRFRPRNPNQRVVGTLEHHMPDLKDPTAKGTLMEPVFFVNGQKVPLGAKDADRRAQLAAWITSPDNPWFARAFVNRIWSELVGEGFYEPVDDLGPDRECSAPATLALLADSFIASGYDIKWLFRAVTATAAYQRASRPRRLPDAPPFVANAPQRLRADQLYNQLVALLGINDGPPERAVAPNAPAIRRGPRTQFNQMFGYDPSAPRDEISGSIPQALILMNAPNLAQAFDARRGPLGRLANSIPNNEQLTVELYLRTLCREPSSAELATCQAHFESAPSRAEATEDLAWALVNSTEFLYRP